MGQAVKPIGVAATWLLMAAFASAQAVYDRDRSKEPGAKTWLAQKAGLPPFTAPRTPDGQPDLRGRWGGSSSGDSIEETPYVDLTTPAAESWVSDPPDGRVPYQPWALARRNEHRAGLSRGWPGESGQRLYTDPQTFCLKSVPRYAQRGFEIVQTKTHVVIMLDWGHYYRSIPLGDRPHIARDARFWMGNPRGRWDGDTLVVDVTNLNGMMWLDSVGNFLSASARVVERFRLVAQNLIDYTITIDDPAVYTRAWTLNYPLQRAGTGRESENNVASLGDDSYAYELWEHACHEGNGPTVEAIKALGFKWFTGVVPPGK
jgi:hypothetical protein